MSEAVNDKYLQRVADYLNFAPDAWEANRELLTRIFDHASYKAEVMRQGDVWHYVARETHLMMGGH